MNVEISGLELHPLLRAICCSIGANAIIFCNVLGIWQVQKIFLLIIVCSIEFPQRFSFGINIFYLQMLKNAVKPYKCCLLSQDMHRMKNGH